MKKVIEIQVEVIFLKEGDVFVAHCPSLNLTSQGDTYEEAAKAFDEAFNIFMEELSEAGTLQKVLEECGWRKAKSTWIVPKVIGTANKKIALPA